jgi:superfamily II DNA/RNA helicase
VTNRKRVVAKDAGSDHDNVNLQVNLDLPRDPATYLHRVGRTGRFGGKGLAVTLLSRDEVEGIRLLARVFKMEISELPSPVPREIYTYAAVEEDTGGDEAEGLAANFAVIEEPSTEEADNGIEPGEGKCEGQNALPSAEQEVVVNEAMPRATPSRYVEEERSYMSWVKLL